VGLTVINMLVGNPISPINCGAIAMVGGFVVAAIVSFLTKPLSEKYVEDIWQCYN
jgi:SSS family solute:Na+ symporter